MQFSKNARPRPKKGRKKAPQGPPKNALQNGHRNPRNAQTLIYKLLWHPLPSSKIDFENSGGSKNCKNPNARKRARCSKEIAPRRNRQTLRFPIVSLLLGRADPPEGRQRGRARRATAGQPKDPIAKYFFRSFRPVRLDRTILLSIYIYIP